MTKTCCKCKTELPLKEFVKDKNRKDGIYPVCRGCRNSYARIHRATYPKKSQGYTRKYKYGITNEDYDKKLNDQGNACAICQTKIPGGNKESFFIDHDHETGKVRGLLCRSCNLMIGHAKDETQLLATAIGYLVYWGQPSPL
jgi:hypothetical protein